jgi:hypothetical protein
MISRDKFRLSSKAEVIRRRTMTVVPTLVALVWLVNWPFVMSGESDGAYVATLERAVTADPENLRACAEYRQQIIASGDYDRAIKLLERLAARNSSGPNVYISLALAYVDKVPVVSSFKRIFLGRDAMRALTVAIDREPSLVAYYIRGLIALYYPEPVFHRARGGIADLEQARGLLSALPIRSYHARVYVSLGDGYWKVRDLARAASIWNDGIKRFPSDPALQSRVENRGAALDRIVERALDPATRVDTSLHELFAVATSP